MITGSSVKTEHGTAMINRILEDVNFLPVLRTAVDDGRVTSPDKAMDALEAFLQWFSVLPTVDDSQHYLMLKGDVDQVWHATIINTVIYRNLCNDYLGRFLDHHSSAATPKTEWVLETVSLIEKVFGSSMHSAFHEWRNQYL